MKQITVYHYEAFSNTPHKGNPAGIVLNGDDLTDEEMQKIAYKVGFNETSFVVKSCKADLKIRYFTPGQEMDLCGHATIATIYALVTKGLLKNKNKVTIETNAGILPITIDTASDDELYICMRQATPQFKSFQGSKKALAHSIGLVLEDLDSELPIVYGHTGIWTLLVPIKSLRSFEKMVPTNQLFPSVLTELPKASVHPFCLETLDENANMHGRHFSSPFSGTVEDPVTGTASGVMGAYYAKYIEKNAERLLKIMVEQGSEINRDGRVYVSIKNEKENVQVEISGNAVYVDTIKIDL